MKLLRIEVEHFACIRRAAVDLGPGLNVLFGPNDLGKSTLARAIRAGLLLPHTSAIARDFIEWDSGENPSVKLTLELPDRRFWRIEKCFGSSGGSSILRESNDGQTFSSPFRKAREVDDEIRTKLGWGIASPASKAAPRGLPTSFLSTVLLGEQTDVTGVLQQTLEADSDESGRARLTAALSALAQNPLFKSILEDAQAKVDVAFTSKGGRKRGKSSPFREVTDEVKRIKAELSQISKQVERNENARRELEAANEELLGRQQARERAHEHHAKLLESRAQMVARTQVEDELAVASTRLKEHQLEIAQLHEREAKLQETRGFIEQALSQHDLQTSEQGNLAASEKAAEQALRRVNSDELEQARKLRHSELSKLELELEAESKDLVVQRESADRAQNLNAELAKFTRRATALGAAREQSEEAARSAEASSLEATRELELLHVGARLIQEDSLATRIDELERVRDAVAADRDQAAQQRALASQIASRIPDGLPDRATLDSMRKLAHALEVTEAKLGGGLTVVVERLEPVELRGRVDGASLELGSQVGPEGPLSFEASRSVALEIGDIARVSVTAGEREAREREAVLRKRWNVEIAPILAAMDAPDLDTLEARAGAAADLRAQADQAVNAAVKLEDRAAAREGPIAKLGPLKEELAIVSRQLEGKPVDQAKAQLDQLGATDLDAHRAVLGRKQADARKAYERAQEQGRAADTEAQVLAERLDGIRKGIAQLAVTEPESGWVAYQAQLAETAEVIATKQRTLADERASLEVQQHAELEQAESALAAVRAQVVIVESKLSEIADKLRSLREQASRLEGEIETRLGSVAKIDLPASTARVNQVRARLEQLPIPAQPVTDENLQAAEHALKTVEHEYERAKDEVRKAEGALQTVGGQVVLEEQDIIKDALRQAEENERDIELEYDAWRLLVTKLREAENTEGQHLGEALSLPVSRRFAELTGDRYGKLEVAAGLAAEGLRVSGVLRQISALSVGSQEQLATLLRLTVAEQLGSMLVLDDHLTQTDPARSAWFRGVLREHARKAQIVVITCRPLDYLLEADMPKQDDVSAARAAGLVRAVDLSRIIERGGPGAG